MNPVKIGRTAEVARKAEPDTSNTPRVQRFEILLCVILVDNGDTAPAPVGGRDCIERRRIVGAVTRRLNDDRPIEPE